jgi:hypothetical protein
MIMATGLLFCPLAMAHGFGQRFTLPLPFWLYASAACTALLLSFLGLVFIKPGRAASRAHAAGPDNLAVPAQMPLQHSAPVWVWMFCNAGLMLLATIAGLAGTQAASSNFAMTWFWIVFVLLFFYLAGFTGTHYRLLNPWWCASQCLAASGLLRNRQVLRYPPWLGQWPALAGFMLLIALELFGHASPARLGGFLAAYSLICATGCLIWGRATWFAHGDLFDGLFRNMALLWAPLRRGGDGDSARSMLLQGFVGWGGQLLIIAMLAATAFDALRESLPWAGALWSTLLTVFPQNTQNPLEVLAALSEHYRRAEMLAWLVMPGIYALIMALTVGLSRRLAPTAHSWQHDMGLAAMALLPLVLGYHLAHYFTLILSEAPNTLHLLSDPLGRGWNLLGTANRWRAPVLLETDTVWHCQVAFIVLGHLGGVLVSHLQACQIHAGRKALVISQLPTLLWMLGLTTWGLWTLSQPLKAG